jgi:hypothetical protein
MTIKRFSSTFKTRNDVMDNITPNNVVQPHIAVPAGEWKPARYLPVQWTGEASKDAFVISSGKVVCLDVTGRVADMSIIAAARALAGVAGDLSAGTHGSITGTGANALITYDSTDVQYGVWSIATMEAAAAGSVFIDEVAQGLLDLGLVVLGRDLDATPFHDGTTAASSNLLIANNSVTASQAVANCLLVLEAFFSAPVGVAAYDVFVWAGDTPDELVFTNYQKQHLIQFLTEVQMKVPVIAEDSATATSLNSGSSYSAGSIFAQVAGVKLTNANLVAFARYSDLGSNVQGMVLNAAGVSRNTERTPFSSAVLVKEKSSPALLKAAGDFYLDAEVGIVLMWDSHADWSNGAITSLASVSFFAKVGASQQYRHIHAVGPLRPGMKLSFDAQSNFCKMGSAQDAHADGTSNTEHIGTVMEIIREPKGLLDRVETAFKGSSFSASAKMPGTATKGFSDMITLSEEVVADELATLIVRF